MIAHYTFNIPNFVILSTEFLYIISVLRLYIACLLRTIFYGFRSGAIVRCYWLRAGTATARIN